jgi:nucleoid-associated protein YgaU
VKERENEVRYVRVKKGDTLWDIAVRAYGSGFMYPKIFKANPQLKSPDMLQVGILLRVPR